MKSQQIALLCAFSVFSVSLWLFLLSKVNHRDTENTEGAQRRSPIREFSCKAGSRDQGALTRGDAPHVVRRLPLAFILRAFGASIGDLCANLPDVALRQASRLIYVHSISRRELGLRNLDQVIVESCASAEISQRL
jgi:hypothetical protein